MVSDDYSPVVRGGLKLKGASKPTGVTKKKKKKSTTTSSDPSTSSSVSETKKSALQAALEEEDTKEAAEKDEAKMKELEEVGGDAKTASERQMEEMRRKRLHERLAKEGVKTHKQRVEELNKYLSNLSEHHDMPRIGPG